MKKAPLSRKGWGSCRAAIEGGQALRFDRPPPSDPAAPGHLPHLDYAQTGEAFYFTIPHVYLVLFPGFFTAPFSASTKSVVGATTGRPYDILLIR